MLRLLRRTALQHRAARFPSHRAAPLSSSTRLGPLPMRGIGARHTLAPRLSPVIGSLNGQLDLSNPLYSWHFFVPKRGLSSKKGRRGSGRDETKSDEEGKDEEDNVSATSGASNTGADAPAMLEVLPGDLVLRASDATAVSEVLVIGIPKPLFPGFGTMASFVLEDDLARALLTLSKRRPAYVGFFARQEPADEKESSSSTGAALAEDLVDVQKPERERERKQFVTSLSQIYKMGTLAEIHYAQHSPTATQFIFGAHHRIEAVDPFPHGNLLKVTVKHHPDSLSRWSGMSEADKSYIKAYTIEMRQSLAALSERGIPARPADYGAMWLFRNQAQIEQYPAYLTDYAVEFCKSAEVGQLQEVLATLDLKSRMHKAVVLLRKELEIYKIKDEINKKVNDQFDVRQRRIVLEEKLKSIKRELGMRDEKEPLIAKYKQRMSERKVPEEAKKVIEEELNRMSGMDSHSLEFSMMRNYLDWLTVLPWGQFTEENFELKRAEEVLNKDHYGMEDVKRRILEFIAVGKLRGAVPQGKIVCLVGPPGVGKTSIGKSIARALNRKFFRFSVGGMNDVAEVKGHRRTYVGAMPGKLIQAMKTTGCANPVILIDEIDKIGHGGLRGDPTSALLEVLDPEQNSTFMDHYLDVPFDLSKVLFICTANVTETIPDPLRDRMDFIRLSGYVGQEKLHIVKQYLEPVERERAGLKPEDAEIHEDAVESLVRWYCREAGVRNLQKHVEKIYRKIAFKKVQGEVSQKVDVRESNLEEFVGKPAFASERMYDRPPFGVSLGLAWSANGGSTLYIESTVADHFPSKRQAKRDKAEAGDEEGGSGSQGSLYSTGQMGDVMKESTEIAYTLAKAKLHSIQPKSDFFQTRRSVVPVHLALEGATPKDGPSAGIAMVTALLSLALKRPIKANLAMTGEVTLTGKVLTIGGVKEKTIAAKRSNVTELILPKGNRKDWDELPDFVRKDISVHFVDTYDEVFLRAFEDEGRAEGSAASVSSPAQQRPTAA